MLENTAINSYIPGYIPPERPDQNALGLAFIGKKLLIKRDGGSVRIPSFFEIKHIKSEFEYKEYIGKYKGHDCFCMLTDSLSSLPEGIELIDIMAIAGADGSSGPFMLAGVASQLLNWGRVNRYCGCCGKRNYKKPDERAMVCPFCGNIVYPRISPATITAIIKGDELLLAHNKNFNNDMYSLIAGFVETGETAEQCVKREIKEEVGINVKNIRYLGSQPWPFPDSLMLGFAAEYESGDISVDNNEITNAGWFRADDMPSVPSTVSIAGKIIRWFCDSHN